MGGDAIDLAAEIQRLMAERGIKNATALADAADLSRSFVHRILAGERPNVTADVLFKLADALGVDANHFRPFVTPRKPGGPAKSPQTAEQEQPGGAPRGKRK